MKSIKLKNNLMVPVFTLLKEAKLKNLASRGRNKFLKRLEEKNKEFNDELTEIRKDFFQVDEKGELKAEDGQFIFKEEVDEHPELKEDLNKRVKELGEETFEISFAEYSTKYEALFEALEHLDEELSGDKALAYDELMDAYENTEEEK